MDNIAIKTENNSLTIGNNFPLFDFVYVCPVCNTENVLYQNTPTLHLIFDALNTSISFQCSNCKKMSTLKIINKEKNDFKLSNNGELK